jgi:hypothetical protein
MCVCICQSSDSSEDYSTGSSSHDHFDVENAVGELDALQSASEEASLPAAFENTDDNSLDRIKAMLTAATQTSAHLNLLDDALCIIAESVPRLLVSFFLYIYIYIS